MSVLIRVFHSKKQIRNCCPFLDSLVSGSPIIQDGKLIGAVTHVFIQDSASGCSPDGVVGR